MVTVTNFLTVAEAEKFLGLSGGRIRQLLLSGQLKGEKCGNQWVIPLSEADEFRALERPPGNPNLRQPAEVG